MIIYKIENKINGKFYIGQTTRNLSSRIYEHKSKESMIGKDISKYGIDNFLIEEVEKCYSIEELNDREQYWINKYNSIVPNGYNSTLGGKGALGWNPSNSWRVKQSKLNSGSNNPMYDLHINQKKVMCIETGEIFESIKEASALTNINGTQISRVCNNKGGGRDTCKNRPLNFKTFDIT